MQTGIEEHKQTQSSSILDQLVDASESAKRCDRQGQTQKHQGPGARRSCDELNGVGGQILLVAQDYQSD